VDRNQYYLADNYIDVSPIARTDTNPASGFPFQKLQKNERGIIEPRKIRSGGVFNLIGGKSWKIKGKYLGLVIMYSTVTIKRVATSKQEMLISDNSIRMFQVERPLGNNKYFTATEERISLISSVFKLKNTSYEIYFYSFFMLMVFVTVFRVVQTMRLRCQNCAVPNQILQQIKR
jgi:hypothetical protein